MTTPEFGIDAIGTYAPRSRVSAGAIREGLGRFHAAGVEEKAVPDVDEDALTIGYEAATRAMRAGEVAPSDIDVLAFATTTPPMAEEEQSVRLAELLGLDNTGAHYQFTGSTRAGTRALVAAGHMVSTDSTTALVVASDCPPGSPDSKQGHAAGAGGAAFVVRNDGAASVVDVATYAAEATGTRFRRTGDETLGGLDITAYDRASFVETTTGAVENLAHAPTDADAVVIQAPDGDLPYRAAGALGISDELLYHHLPAHSLGDLGAASVPVALASALDADVDQVLAVSHGSGTGSDALVIQAADIPTDRDETGDVELDYAEYITRVGDVTRGEPSGGGAYVSVPTWQRTLAQRYRLEGGQCPECGSLTLVPDGACPSCYSAVEYDPIQLERTGTVRTTTIISQGGAPPEFVEQQAKSGDFAVIIVAFDGPDGGTAAVPAQVVDADPESISVGDRVEATIRRIYDQERVIRYGFKVRPVEK